MQEHEFDLTDTQRAQLPGDTDHEKIANAVTIASSLVNPIEMLQAAQDHEE